MTRSHYEHSIVLVYSTMITAEVIEDSGATVLNLFVEFLKWHFGNFYIFSFNA